MSPPLAFLSSQLQNLSSWPNRFQSHARASLRLIGRRQGEASGCHTEEKDKEKEEKVSLPYDYAMLLAIAQENLHFERQLSAPSVDVCKASINSASASTSFSRAVTEDTPKMARRRSGNCFSSFSSSLSPRPWPSEVLELLCDPQRRSNTCPPDFDEASIAAFPVQLRLQCGSKQIPHPRKAEYGGEDSFFICPQSQVVGVADGVGEWEWRFGLNPRAFADELMRGACRAASEAASVAASEDSGSRALSILEAGYEATRSFGSATALVAAMVDQTLNVACLGDAGLCVLRWEPGFKEAGLLDANSVRIVHRTAAQQHSFNCPYQLCRLPGPEDFERLRQEGLGKLVRTLKGSARSLAKQDQPSSAFLYSFDLQLGDLVLLGTDGVFDNLYDEELCSLASFVMNGRHDPQLIAAAVARAAFHRSQDSSARTPFGQSAKEAGIYHVGGKSDDITVIAAWVTCTDLSNTDRLNTGG